MIDISKVNNLKGYTLKVINNKKKEVCSFKPERSKYEFPVDSWGGPGTYFLEVFDEADNLHQVYKIQLSLYTNN